MHVNIYMCTYVYSYIYVCTLYIYIHLHMYMCKQVYIYVYIYIYMYDIYIYIYTYIKGKQGPDQPRDAYQLDKGSFWRILMEPIRSVGRSGCRSIGRSIG